MRKSKEDIEYENSPGRHANLCDSCADHQEFSGELVEIQCLSCRKMAEIPKEILDRTPWFSGEHFCRDCMVERGTCHICGMGFIIPSPDKVKDWMERHISAGSWK